MHLIHLNKFKRTEQFYNIAYNSLFSTHYIIHYKNIFSYIALGTHRVVYSIVDCIEQCIHGD